MCSCCQLHSFYTMHLGYQHLFVTLGFFRELPVIISKRYTSKYMIYRLYLYSKKFFSGVCILCHDGNNTLVQQHVHRVYIVILGLQFIYTSKCIQTRFGMYLMCTHPCANYHAHTSVYMSALHESFCRNFQSGTSQSAPLVAGAIAVLLENILN